MPWNPFRRAQTLPDNKALNALLVTGAQNPETDRAPLLNELLKSTLIVPLYEPAERSGQGGHDPIKCVMIESQGKRALVGLTDQIALRRFDAEAAFPTALLPARELARIALTGNFDTLVLNPAGPIGYTLSPVEIQSLADGVVRDHHGEVTVKKSTQVLIGMPSVRPSEEVLNKMQHVIQAAGVSEAYWFWMAIEGIAPHLGLSLNTQDRETTSQVGKGIEPLWAAERPDNPVFDILPLQGELGDHIRNVGERLYPPIEKE